MAREIKSQLTGSSSSRQQQTSERTAKQTKPSKKWSNSSESIGARVDEKLAREREREEGGAIIHLWPMELKESRTREKQEKLTCLRPTHTHTHTTHTQTLADFFLSSHIRSLTFFSLLLFLCCCCCCRLCARKLSLKSMTSSKQSTTFALSSCVQIENVYSAAAAVALSVREMRLQEKRYLVDLLVCLCANV